MLRSLVLLATATSLLSGGCQAKKPIGLYVGALRSSPSLDVVDADLAGVAVGLQGIGDQTYFMEMRASSDSDVGLDFVELLFGGRWASEVLPAPKLGVQLDLGITGADLDGLRNSNSLVSVGGGIFAEFPLSQAATVVAFGGGRYYLDTTEPTTCNDGTKSKSTGSGTCSHHGGIRNYNDYIGDGFAPEVSIGVRFRF